MLFGFTCCKLSSARDNKPSLMLEIVDDPSAVMAISLGEAIDGVPLGFITRKDTV